MPNIPPEDVAAHFGRCMAISLRAYAGLRSAAGQDRALLERLDRLQHAYDELALYIFERRGDLIPDEQLARLALSTRAIKRPATRRAQAESAAGRSGPGSQGAAHPWRQPHSRAYAEYLRGD